MSRAAGGVTLTKKSHFKFRFFNKQHNLLNVLFDCPNVRNKSVKQPGVKIVDTHSLPLTLEMAQGKAEMYRHTVFSDTVAL